MSQISGDVQAACSTEIVSYGIEAIMISAFSSF